MTGATDERAEGECKDDCARALSHLYEFLDNELETADADAIREHLAACEPCLDTFDAEQAMKKLIKRGCSGEIAPEHLRTKVLSVIASSTTASGTTVSSTTVEIREI